MSIFSKKLFKNKTLILLNANFGSDFYKQSLDQKDQNMFMLKPVHFICYSLWNAIHEESGIEFQSHCVLQNQLIFVRRAKTL